jgi:hypothetical protein
VRPDVGRVLRDLPAVLRVGLDRLDDVDESLHGVDQVGERGVAVGGADRAVGDLVRLPLGELGGGGPGEKLTDGQTQMAG